MYHLICCTTRVSLRTCTLLHLYYWSASAYTIKFCRMSYARGWHNTIYNRKKRCANSKDATAFLDRISVWCNVNHILINPVKTKSMIITTRQKHQLSDLSLRLSLDGQNFENVTEHRLLGLIVDNKSGGKPRSNTCKSMSKEIKMFLLSQLQHIINIEPRKLFYNAHIKPYIDYASVVWNGCGEVHFKNNN